MELKSKQYSQALYEIAKESNQLDDYLALAVAFIDAANHNEGLIEYLGSTSVDLEEKKVLIKDITNEYEYFNNWLLILIESGKGRYIRDYISAFINKYNEEHDIENGYVWTTEPVTHEVIEKFEKVLSDKMNKTIKLENRINNEIIGGIKLEVGDNVWDNTIKNKLTQLIEKGSETNE